MPARKASITASVSGNCNLCSAGTFRPNTLDENQRLSAGGVGYAAEKFGHVAWGNLFAAAQLRQHLCVIGTELHKGLYILLLDSTAPDSVKAYALAKAQSRLSWVADKLAGR